jgi:alpha-amylase
LILETKPNWTTKPKYNSILQKDLKGFSVMNYISSHDDGYPFDKKREHAISSGTKLLLAPGIAQVYYGDETARSLDIPEAVGDATLRSFMNWNEVEKNKHVLEHWQKLGKFRANHPSIGAGIHNMITSSPYVFSREYNQNNINDKVIIGLDLPKGTKQISVGNLFDDGTKLHDAYSGKTATVINGIIHITTDYDVLLLEKN